MTNALPLIDNKTESLPLSQEAIVDDTYFKERRILQIEVPKVHATPGIPAAKSQPPKGGEGFIYYRPDLTASQQVT